MVSTEPLKGPVLVIGATGMLGRACTELLRALNVDVITADFPGLDLRESGSIARAVDGRCPVVINCAAHTDVDGAEADLDTALAVNARGVGWLAQRCGEVGATLVHYSTDYVFDGRATAPYRIDHPKSPVNAYGRSKAEGEEALIGSGARFLLIRTSWLYAPWGKNFVRTIARLGAAKPTLRVVNDQHGRPTSAERLAETTLALLQTGETGIFHAADGGECTWYDFAHAIVTGLGLPTIIDPCTSAEFPRPAARPAYSVLDLSRTESLIGPRRLWTESLASVLLRLEHPL